VHGGCSELRRLSSRCQWLSLIKPDTNAVERAELSAGMKKCPFCAELVKKEAVVCKHCKRDLPPQDTQPTLPSVKAKYDHLVCHHTLPWLISISLDNFAYAQGQYNKDGRAHIVLTERKIQRCGQSAILARRVRISQEERSMRWTCKACRYVKHFTKAVPLEAAGKCPRCKSTEFKPIL